MKPPRNNDSIKRKKEQAKPLDRQVMCRRCKMMGHHATDCRKCYKCGLLGHVGRRCPQGAQQKMQKQGQSSQQKQPGVCERCPQKVQQDEAQLGQTEHPPLTQLVQLQMQQVDESRNDWMVLDPSTSNIGI